MELIDGKKIAAEYHEVLKARVMDMDRNPALAVILVGDDYASHLYVKLKEKAAKKIGIDFHKYLFDAHISQEELIESIKFLHDDESIDGMIVQLPLPEGLDTDAVIDALGKEKDVDGFHKDNLEAFIAGDESVYPVFPKALITLAEDAEKNLEGKQATIIGHSDLFLSAMVAACTRVGMKVYRIEESEMEQRKDLLKESDIIFTAVGKPRILTAEHIKKDAIIIDGGISDENGETVGDVDVKSVEKIASHVSPVPGGVGPVTIACLLENVTDLAQKNMEE